MASLMSFVHFQSLVRVEISGSPITDDGLVLNCEFPELKEFRADGSRIEDPSLVARFAPNLVIISLLFCKIASIESVQALASSGKSLASIDLPGNPVNADSYPDPARMSYGDQLSEYESEELYDSEFPDTAGVRSRYRQKVIGSASASLIWLDGIKVPGRGGQSAIPPSRMHFQLNEEGQTDEANLSQTEQSIQCDISSSISESEPYHNFGSQTEAIHRPKHDLQRYVAFTDDESDRSSDADVPLSVNSDSDRLAARADPEAEEWDDEDFDRFSAATDLESELFHAFQSPHQLPARADAPTNQRGGCAFWVPMQQEVRRKPSTNIPPFRNRPVLPKDIACGHWPFNARSARRLPWDTEVDTIPEPESHQAPEKKKKLDPRRGPRPPVVATNKRRHA
jgi:hypothetical protein